MWIMARINEERGPEGTLYVKRRKDGKGEKSDKTVSRPRRTGHTRSHRWKPGYNNRLAPAVGEDLSWFQEKEKTDPHARAK